MPSLACLVVPALLLSTRLKGNLEQPVTDSKEQKRGLQPADSRIVFISGITCLILVPVFKTVTHLPPFMGMMLALGIMWVITEIVNSAKDNADKDFFSVLYALRKIDASSILFFLGILISVAALQSVGLLTGLAHWLDNNLKEDTLIVTGIGVLSAIVDNVPLVAASTGMYGLEQYPADHHFWLFLAYCTGTGGSILIIGSAAGVAAMGIEKIEFFWYLKKIGWLALVGYVAGILVFLLQERLFGY